MVLHPQECCIQIAKFANSKPPGYPDGGSRVRPETQTEIEAQVLRDGPEAYPVGQAFGDAAQLRLSGAESDGGLCR